ncbi:helix-turn-helix transcriptional regulator [Candidatus Woesearchaeota archaeon]|nr:helix-turn-helix transcriptional regulator [Candidatus Woesearchaeota archaeon]
MSKKSFILVSLKENKAKKIAEVISNNTCRKMLDFLANRKDATESEISKELKIALSTVHYNMKALMQARLVKCDEYHYSSKGKEVNHYMLANQYVIIAPEGEKKAIREKLRSIIPTALIMGAAAGIIKIFYSSVGSTLSSPMRVMESGAAAPVMEEAAYEATQMISKDAAVGVANDIAVESVPVAQNVVERVPEVGQQFPEIALWFFVGAVVGVGVYLLIEYIVKRVRER